MALEARFHEDGANFLLEKLAICRGYAGIDRSGRPRELRQSHNDCQTECEDGNAHEVILSMISANV